MASKIMIMIVKEDIDCHFVRFPGTSGRRGERRGGCGS
jgi:hypothetical protein